MAAIFERVKRFLGSDNIEEYEDSTDDDEQDVMSRYSSISEDDEEDDDIVDSIKPRFTNTRFSFASQKASTSRDTNTSTNNLNFNSRKKEEVKKVVSTIGSNNTGLQVVLSKPKEFDACSTICSHLRSQMTIILNLEDVANTPDRKRIFDFVSGCCFALDGNIQKVSELIYVVAPFNVDVFAQTEIREQEKMSRDSERTREKFDFASMM